MPGHLRLRRVTTHSPLSRIAMLPSGPDKTVGPRIAYFEAQCPCLHMRLSTLQVRPHGRPRMTRIQDGWLFLSWRLFHSQLHAGLSRRYLPAQAYLANFLATFREYPQRLKAASFNLDEVAKKMQSPGNTKVRRDERRSRPAFRRPLVYRA
jgi:hypothetical protein